MKKFFIIVLAAIPLFCNSAPHLTLYFDINKTLIASDKAGNKSVENILNELLAEKYKARWDDSLKEEISFYDYASEILVPGPKDDKELKNKRKQYIFHFIDYLRGRNHPIFQPALKEYNAALDALFSFPSQVFLSFYRLIDYLDQNKISYSIILRSFGEEVFEVKDEINIFREDFFKRTGKFREGALYLDDGTKLENPISIYNGFRRMEHAAINDDWSNWDAHSESIEQGKPFYIDTDDAETLPIFFDDNISEDDSKKNIIAPLDPKTGKLIPIENLVQSGQAIKVDTLQAILNPDYYINCVQRALEKHPLQKLKTTNMENFNYEKVHYNSFF